MKTIFSIMKRIKFYNSNLILITFFTIFIFSCSQDDDKCAAPITELSQEIKDLIYFKGDEKARIVFLNVQGGPGVSLSTNEVDTFFGGAFKTDNILMANVIQKQMLDPSILEGNDITLEQAVNFNTESVEILNKVIKYFKDQGRIVYVLGVSYGAFLTQDLIVKKGIDTADKYLIVSGRLDINDTMWQGLLEGKEVFFQNGITPMLDSAPHPSVVERNGLRLQGGFGKNRYTQLFNSISDLSNLTYVYGEIDEAVGSLTNEEVTFLESKNANIISGPYDHTDTYELLIIQALYDAFGIETN